MNQSGICRQSVRLAIILVFLSPLVRVGAQTGDQVETSKTEIWKKFTFRQAVTVILPKNWKPMTESGLITLQASTQARSPKRNEAAKSELEFGANLSDDSGNDLAKFNIRFYPEETSDQNEVEKATHEDLAKMDSQMANSREFTVPSKIVKILGNRILKVNGKLALVTEYIRGPSKDEGDFIVRLVRFYLGPKTFTVAISYRLSQEVLLQPICDHIISSIEAN